MKLNGVDIDMRVGAKLIEIPFSIKLENFELERYPGSMTPSSRLFSIWTGVWPVRGPECPRTGENPRIWRARRSAEAVPAIWASQARHLAQQ